MYFPTREQFRELARQGNLVPVYREILADMETPVSVLKRLKGRPYCFLLESVTGGEHIARNSFIGRDPFCVFESAGRTVRIHRGRQTETRELRPGETPLDALRELLASFRLAPVEGLPNFCGGAVGYIGYDMVRFFEHLPNQPPDDLGLPDCVMMLVDELLVFDHVTHTIKIVALGHPEGDVDAAYDDAVARIEATVSLLQDTVPDRGPLDALSLRPGPRSGLPPGVRTNFPRERFLDAVRRCKDYIAAGDVIQVVISQRLSMDISVDPFDIYRCLRSINPSPYMFYLGLRKLKIVGSSPEILVTHEEGRVRVRPIAGTRPRGATPEEDLRLERELLADEKERAEHIMLVDLGRNDLGRVCKYGTVRLAEGQLMVIERYSHVMHIVSEVVGELAEGNDAMDVLEATFPAGTVSGAPKIRAMEIIDELEPTKRGPYAGAVGYISFSGKMDTCITIRTIVIHDSVAHVQAGAGIVADSVPEREHEECLNKAMALLKAIQIAAEAS